MRWDGPKLGQYRVKRRFAWFPVETTSSIVVWLEYYYVKQVYICLAGDCYWHDSIVVTEGGLDLLE